MNILRPAALLCALACSFGTQAATTGTGSLSDALEGSNADLSSATITVDSSGAVNFSVTFGPAATLATASAGFALDIDQNIATGSPGTTTLATDSALLGTDFLVLLNSSSFQATASLYSFAAGGTFLGSIVLGAVDYVGSTLSVSTTLAALGGDDGLMNFKVLSQEQLDNNLYTTIKDFMSDVGQPVGSVTAVPEPGTWTLMAAGLAALVGSRRLATSRRQAIAGT